MVEEKLEYSAVDVITNGPRVRGSCVMDSSGVTWTSSEESQQNPRKENDDDDDDDGDRSSTSKIFAAAGDIKEINYSQVPGGVQVLLRVKPEKGSAKTICLQGFRGQEARRPRHKARRPRGQEARE